jgi:hypothetical protein
VTVTVTVTAVATVMDKRLGILSVEHISPVRLTLIREGEIFLSKPDITRAI